MQPVDITQTARNGVGDKGSKSTLKIKSSKTKAALAVLLSPRTALQSANNQALLFGTSSQLVRDESPAFLRDLRAACKESEAMLMHEADFADSSSVVLLDGEKSLSKNLWSAGSRNLEGTIGSQHSNDRLYVPPMDNDIQQKPALDTADSFVDISVLDTDLETNADAILPPIPPDANQIKQPHLALSSVEHTLDLPRSVAESALKNRSRSRSPARKSKKGLRASATAEMPDFDKMTPAKLSKSIAEMGFKPIKSRDAKIALLKSCWESKARIALQSLPPNTNSSNGAAAPKKAPETLCEKPTKQPRMSKDTPASAVDGGEADPAVPKRRGRPPKVADGQIESAKPSKVPSKKAAPTAPLVQTVRDTHHDPFEDAQPPSAADAVQQLALAPPPQPFELIQSQPSSAPQIDLSTAITLAITTFPSRHDTKNLTWHEKILMYDPIVLEDLTTWLNTEGLGRVGVDEEVWPGLVREWCEARSVCCLWRENLRGGKRSRY